MSFSTLTDYIILASALTIAITNIYNFVIKRPHAFIKGKQAEEEKKKNKEFYENFDKNLEEKLPKILLNHDLEIRKQCLADTQQYLTDIKEEILNDTKETLEGILKLNLEQSKNIEILYKTSKDVLRQRIMTIYHEYKKEKRFPIHVKEALDELYKDYKAENGNSYIDKYYGRMSTWETYDDENF